MQYYEVQMITGIYYTVYKISYVSLVCIIMNDYLPEII